MAPLCTLTSDRPGCKPAPITKRELDAAGLKVGQQSRCQKLRGSPVCLRRRTIAFKKSRVSNKQRTLFIVAWASPTCWSICSPSSPFLLRIFEKKGFFPFFSMPVLQSQQQFNRDMVVLRLWVCSLSQESKVEGSAGSIFHACFTLTHVPPLSRGVSRCLVGARL